MTTYVLTVDVHDLEPTGPVPATAEVRLWRALPDGSASQVVSTRQQTLKVGTGPTTATLTAGIAYWAEFTGVRGWETPFLFSGTTDTSIAERWRNGQLDPTGLQPLTAVPTLAAAVAAVQAQLTAILQGAPGAYDTFLEVATQFGLDEATVTALQALVAGKAPLASPALTGTPTAPTVAGSTDSSTALATTAFVQAVATALGTSVAATYGTLDDEGYDLVLLLGQSNMSGRGTPYDQRLDPPDSRIYQYGSSGVPGTYAAVISQAIEPLVMHDTPTGIGPGLVFARWYASALPLGRRVLLVPAAHGGTPLSSTAALGWRRGVTGNLYDQALAQARAALAAAGANAQIVAALWEQGETDGDNSTTGTQYQTDLDALITGLRSDLALPNLPFVIGEMVPDYLKTGTRAAINTVQAATPTRLTRTAFAQGPVAMTMNDGNHYNAAAQRLQGRALYTAYRRIITGTPDPALPAVPGQVSGVSTSNVTGNGATLSWNAISGSPVYAVEYKPSASPTWNTLTSTTSTTATVASLSPSTSYDFRVTAINAGGPGTASSTVTATTAAAPALLDAISTAGMTAVAGAWSENRRLRSAYAGSAVQIRRSSDSTTLDIGFTAGGSVDWTSALTFVGAGDGYLAKVYDQSGKGKDRIQATTALQRKVITAGALVSANGITLPVFDGTSMYESITAGLGLYAAGAATFAAVVKGAAQTDKRYFVESETTNTQAQYALGATGLTSGAHQQTMIKNESGTGIIASDGTVTAFDGTLHQLAQTDSGTSAQRYVDGATDGTAVAITRAGALTPSLATFGALVRNGTAAAWYAGALPEAVAFTAVLSGADLTAVQSSMKAFYSTP